jgi:hypothetical protein
LTPEGTVTSWRVTVDHGPHGVGDSYTPRLLEEDAPLPTKRKTRPSSRLYQDELLVSASPESCQTTVRLA